MNDSIVKVRIWIEMNALLLFIQNLFLTSVASSKLKQCDEADTGGLCKLSNDYDKGYPPKPSPAIVQPTITIREITRMDEGRKSLSILAEIVQEWIDGSITVKDYQGTSDYGWYKMDDYISDLWLPILYFKKVHEVKKIITVGATTNADLWIHPKTHRFWYREIVEVTFACDIKDYSYFPIDEHFCNFLLEDGDNTAERMLFNQSRFAYDSQVIETSQESMTILDTTTQYEYELTQHQPYFRESSFGYQFHSTGVSIKLHRKNLGSLMSTFYIPVATFTMVSMISFMIKPDSVPGRMGMIVTLLLITTSIYNVVDAPQNRGLSYAEIWIIGSQIPIVFALVEYGLILMLTRDQDQNFKGLFWIDVLACITGTLFYLTFNIYYWYIIFRGLD